MTLQTIVNVQITRATAALSRVGFGTPLLLTAHEVAIPAARLYTDPADMLTDGFVATDPTYLMALALTGQELNVTQWVVGKRTNQPIPISKTGKRVAIFHVYRKTPGVMNTCT